MLAYKQEKDEETSKFEDRMENMLAELENMKCMVDQVTGERDDAVERLADAGRLVKSKE